ncbi:MAG: ATP-binding cassette domain-containing protein [Desulfosporosinus sp.]|nr:ATP-binding cassette domain-containing protein [Desulfosporosinus sp.]
MQNVCYGNILNGVNFDWHQGEILALMGTNGSGKSTLARLLAGLIEPQEGEIRLALDGVVQNWNTVTRWQEIGLVGQHPRRQTIGATVAEELGFGLMNLGMDIQSVRNKARELASSVGLGGKEDQSTASLSGGERQRLVTVAILALKPSFLILDEALTMLDTRSQAKVLELLFRAHAETGQLWITHDLELARHADRLLIIKNGIIQDMGKPSDAFSNSERHSLYAPGEVDAKPISPRQKHLLAKDAGQQGSKDSLNRPVLEWKHTTYESRFWLDKVVYAGEYIGIVGPSGSGKTTLLESAIGLILPIEGQFMVCGEQITKTSLNTVRRKTRLVLQEAGEYLIGRSVYHEIFYGESRRDLRIKTQEKLALLEEFGLSVSLADVAPERLSGGERQKVALAAALRTPPEILLLDEPLLGLDATSRSGIQKIISAWAEITILYVTHDLREVLQDANRIWLVENGNVVLDCSVQSWQEHREKFRAAGVRC